MTVRLSHTSLATFRTCPQKYKYTYIDGLESKTDRWKYNKDLGSAIHAGIEGVLRHLATGGGVNDNLQVGIRSIRLWVEENTQPDRTVLDYNTGRQVRDEEYYKVMEQIYNEAPKILEFLLPELELGTRYQPAWLHDFFDIDEDGLFDCEEDKPIIEWNFIMYDDQGRVLEGVIDSVLLDTHTSTFVLFDWKVRSAQAMLDETTGVQDSQLLLYASVLNSLADKNKVSEAVMMQLLNQLPNPAKLNKATSKKPAQPSIQASVSTWDFWWNSIPDDVRKRLNESEWKEIMSEKLKDKSHWIRPISIAVTSAAMSEVDRNTEFTLNMIDHAYRDRAYVRNWTPSKTGACAFCAFKVLCQAERSGIYENDARYQHLVASHYQPRISAEDDEDSE